MGPKLGTIHKKKLLNEPPTSIFFLDPIPIIASLALSKSIINSSFRDFSGGWRCLHEFFWRCCSATSIGFGIQAIWGLEKLEDFGHNWDYFPKLRLHWNWWQHWQLITQQLLVPTTFSNLVVGHLVSAFWTFWHYPEKKSTRRSVELFQKFWAVFCDMLTFSRAGRLIKSILNTDWQMNSFEW